MRVERLWPASTGLLIASIIFGHKFWIWDATQMSLYWVARLPIERPKGQSPEAIRRDVDRSISNRFTTAPNRRQWKIALSLAIVGAFAAPFISGTIKANPTHTVWVPLTTKDEQNLTTYLQSRRWCREETHNVTLDFECARDARELDDGGHYEYYSDEPRYLMLNVGVSAATFVSAFGLVFLIPMLVRGVAFLIRRYWKWLHA